LLWTTETELLFAVEKGLFAACPCVGVEQVIDMKKGSLENIVLFENDSRPFVGSTIAPDETDATGVRFDFAFSSCSLRWRGTDVPLPPIGKGWGDLLYLDDDLRVTRGGDGRPPASLLLFDGAQGGALFDPVFRTNTSTSQVALRAHARRRAGGHAHRGRAAGAIRRGEPRRRLRRRPGELEPLDPGRFLGRGRAGTGINK